MARFRRVLVTGSLGQLGRDLVDMLSGIYDVTGVDIDELDITDRKAALSLVVSRQPDVLIHAAAYTDVDGCESNRDQAFAVNADGTHNLALACRETGARMIYYSTDYVFAGAADRPYTEDDTPDPVTIYGQSKLAGEKSVAEVLDDFAVVRIAWVYGKHGRNFPKTMIRIGGEQLKKAESGEMTAPLKVVDDQFGNPTWTEEIVRQTHKIIESDMRGIVHATSEGETSWFGFARDIFAAMKMPVKTVPCTTEEFPRPAPRPMRSSLENSRLKTAGLNLMRDYREALREFLDRNGKGLTT